MRTRNLVAAALLLLAATLAAAPPALATLTRPHDVTCPACDLEFQVLIVTSTNTFGGTDLDLCVHANGDQPMPLQVWTCPRCHWSRHGSTFERKPRDEIVTWSRTHLEPALPIDEDASQDEIPGWVKVDLAIRILQEEGAGDVDLGIWYQRAAWLVRVDTPDLVQPILRDESASKRWDAAAAGHDVFTDAFPWQRHGTRTHAGRQILGARGLVETPGEDEPMRRLLAAWILRRRGECLDAEDLLGPLAARDAKDTLLRDVALDMLASIERERQFQVQACVHLERAVKEESDPGPRRAEWCFALAEMHRRLGTEKQAANYLAMALEDPDLPPMAWAAAMDAVMVGLGGDSSSRFRRATTGRELVVMERWRPRFLDVRTDRLADPDSCEEAAEVLALLGDDEALGGILGALEHEDPLARRYACIALRGYPGPRPDVLKRLHSVALDQEEDDEVRWDAAETLVTWADPQSARVFRALRDEEMWLLPDLPVRGLGLTGDGSDIPGILALREEMPEEADEALARLAALPATALQHPKAWWKAHGEETREDWLRAAFEGILPQDRPLADRENIPLLLPLLRDERNHLRWNAWRLLVEATGRVAGAAHLLDKGRVPSEDPEESMGLRHIVSEGGIYVYGPRMDMSAMPDEIMHSMRLPHAKRSWNRTAADWRTWWIQQDR